MSREILTNRWFLGGCGFLIAFGIACYFWYQHELAPYKQQAAEAQQQLEASRKAKDASHTDSIITESAHETTDNTEKVVEDINDSNSQNVVSIEKTEADVPVSPHGFGPYLEIPEGFGHVTWSRRSRNSELAMRVRIKLFSQGIDVRGATMEYGKIYPTIKGILYVKWDIDNDGEKYICERLSTAEDGDRLSAIREAKFNRGEDDSLTEADIPSDIKIVPYEEGGIDPYEFLGLIPT